MIETSVCLLFPSPPPSPPPHPTSPLHHTSPYPPPPPPPRWTMDAEKQFSFQERIKILEVFTGKKCSTGPPPPLPHPPPPYRFHKMPDNADTKTQRLGTPGTLFVCSFHFRELKVIETSVCLLLPSPPSSPSSLLPILPPPPPTAHQPPPTQPLPPTPHRPTRRSDECVQAWRIALNQDFSLLTSTWAMPFHWDAGRSRCRADCSSGPHICTGIFCFCRRTESCRVTARRSPCCCTHPRSGFQLSAEGIESQRL